MGFLLGALSMVLLGIGCCDAYNACRERDRRRMIRRSMLFGGGSLFVMLEASKQLLLGLPSSWVTALCFVKILALCISLCGGLWEVVAKLATGE